MLRIIKPGDVAITQRSPVDAETLAAAARIVDDVASRGEAALREHAERLGDVVAGAPLTRSQAELKAAFDSLPADQQAVLNRTRTRIENFARAQRATLTDLKADVPGGHAGHRAVPVDAAGCYAPGGRFPLPSSVLMTAVCARAAGVPVVWAASPRPAPATLAAAHVAGVDGFLAVGGAQGIAALAFGAGPVPRCDVVVGPGNRWVTAAKQLVAGRVGIDMLAGPSELVVLADGEADARTVAADLLAQAEHDPEALPVLVTTSSELLARVQDEVTAQLAALPTKATAGPAVEHGFAVLVDSMAHGAEVCDALAPEHLELMGPSAEAQQDRVRHYGALFIGSRAAEVFGDYGAGPNHVLPTGGTSRHTAGLSVFTFLRVRTWLVLHDDAGVQQLAADAVTLARMEGLEGHARSAERRLSR
ncbi:MAG: histidinol dehydrogenase [Candidatus Xenobia bacterium]